MIVFGLAVGPLGFVSLMLLVFQLVLFSAWRTLCLASTVIAIAIIGPTIDKLLVSLRYMKRVKNSEASIRKAFWDVKSEFAKVD